jgi:hypothetical protein
MDNQVPKENQMRIQIGHLFDKISKLTTFLFLVRNKTQISSHKKSKMENIVEFLLFFNTNFF